MDASYSTYVQRNGFIGADANHSFYGLPDEPQDAVHTHLNKIPNVMPTIAETCYLRSRVATLEHFLIECQKEKTAAQKVIDYLLKQLAKSPTGSECLGAVGACYGQHAAAIAVDKGVEIEIWRAITSVSQKLSTLQDSISGQHRVPTSQETSEDLLGDLLGDLDDQGKSQQQHDHPSDHGSSTSPDRASQSSAGASNTHSWSDSNHELRGQPPGPSPNVAGQPFASEDKSFARGPYITRFSRPNNAYVSHPSTSPDADPDVLGPQTSPLRPIGLPAAASGSDYNGTTANSRSDEASAGMTCASTLFSAANETGQSFLDRSSNHSLDRNTVFDHARSSIELFSAKHRKTSRDSSEQQVEVSSEYDDDSGNAAPSSAAVFVPTWHINSSINSSFIRECSIQAYKNTMGHEEVHCPYFFKYGIRFCPHPSEANIYRTVLIDKLPRNLSISTLLEAIRGGAVLDAKLLDTSSINGYSSALIQFVHEHSAKSMETQAERKPFTFSGVQARVTLLPTPTWPMSSGSRAATMVHGYTRCIEIHNLSPSITPAELKRDLRLHEAMAPSSSHRIEFMEKRPNGVIEIRYTSVAHAGRAYGILTTHSRYKTCRVKRSPDPCTQPWDRTSSENGHVSASSAALQANKPKSADNNTEQLRQQRLLEIFKKPTTFRPSSHGSTSSIDQTGRLSNVDDDPVAERPRGRGFSFGAPRHQHEKSCAQQ
ncbi:MAG: hypothetical protein Q9174_002282 [Haloplaca sp. 1 TL-2023]